MNKENYKKVVEEIRQMEESDRQEMERQERIEELHSEIKRMVDEYEKFAEEIVGEGNAKVARSSYQRGALDTLKLLGYE